jgi:hypothetical protein
MIVKSNAASLAVYDLRAVGLLAGFLILEERQEPQARHAEPGGRGERGIAPSDVVGKRPPGVPRLAPGDESPMNHHEGSPRGRDDDLHGQAEVARSSSPQQ